jgi:hypothetical protein
MKGLHLAFEDDLTGHKLQGSVPNDPPTLVKGKSNLAGAVLELCRGQVQSFGQPGAAFLVHGIHVGQRCPMPSMN